MTSYSMRSRWANMLSRCEDSDHRQYKDYGGRGVYVCEEWHVYENFYNWCINNGVTKGLQIDRVDNNGPYRPDNCRVVTRLVNARNKRSNRLLTAFGETKCLVEWSEDPRCVVSHSTLLTRISRGWPDEKAIKTKPSETRGGRNAHNAQKYNAFGESRLLKDWIVDYPVSKQTFHWRVKNGWTVEGALTGIKVAD